MQASTQHIQATEYLDISAGNIQIKAREADRYTFSGLFSLSGLFSVSSTVIYVFSFCNVFSFSGASLTSIADTSDVFLTPLLS